MIEQDDWARLEQFVVQRTAPLDVLVRQLQGALAKGVFTTWNWSGSNFTDLSIPHGLRATPTGFITSGFIRGSEATIDARMPWMVAPLSRDATNLVVRVTTLNKAAIGAFAANEPIYWLAWL